MARSTTAFPLASTMVEPLVARRPGAVGAVVDLPEVGEVVGDAGWVLGADVALAAGVACLLAERGAEVCPVRTAAARPIDAPTIAVTALMATVRRHAVGDRVVPAV